MLSCQGTWKLEMDMAYLVDVLSTVLQSLELLLMVKPFSFCLISMLTFQLVYLIVVLLSGNNAIGQKIQGQVREAEQSSGAKALPEYLKQKLRARGILKEDADHNNSVRTDVPNLLKHA